MQQPVEECIEIDDEECNGSRDTQPDEPPMEILEATCPDEVVEETPGVAESEQTSFDDTQIVEIVDEIDESGDSRVAVASMEDPPSDPPLDVASSVDAIMAAGFTHYQALKALESTGNELFPAIDLLLAEVEHERLYRENLVVKAAQILDRRLDSQVDYQSMTNAELEAVVAGPQSPMDTMETLPMEGVATEVQEGDGTPTGITGVDLQGEATTTSTKVPGDSGNGLQNEYELPQDS